MFKCGRISNKTYCYRETNVSNVVVSPIRLIAIERPMFKCGSISNKTYCYRETNVLNVVVSPIRLFAIERPMFKCGSISNKTYCCRETDVLNVVVSPISKGGQIYHNLVAIWLLPSILVDQQSASFLLKTTANHVCHTVFLYLLFHDLFSFASLLWHFFFNIYILNAQVVLSVATIRLK